MNKKETAAFEQLKQDLRLAKALSWTQPVAPDVLPPQWNEPRSTGWNLTLTNGYGGGDSVSVACSSSAFHAVGRTDKTNTQGPRSLYSTPLRALQALRHEVEKQCAERLAKIDACIEKELAAESSPNGTDK